MVDQCAPTGMIRILVLQWPADQTPPVPDTDTGGVKSDGSGVSGPEASGPEVPLPGTQTVVVQGGLSQAKSTQADTSQAAGSETCSFQDWSQLTLQGDLQAVAFNAAYGAPAMSGVTGLLHLEYGLIGLL